MGGLEQLPSVQFGYVLRTPFSRAWRLRWWCGGATRLSCPTRTAVLPQCKTFWYTSKKSSSAMCHPSGPSCFSRQVGAPVGCVCGPGVAPGGLLWSAVAVRSRGGSVALAACAAGLYVLWAMDVRAACCFTLCGVLSATVCGMCHWWAPVPLGLDRWLGGMPLRQPANRRPPCAKKGFPFFPGSLNN